MSTNRIISEASNLPSLKGFGSVDLENSPCDSHSSQGNDKIGLHPLGDTVTGVGKPISRRQRSSRIKEAENSLGVVSERWGPL